MSQNHSLQIPDPNVVFPNEYKTSCFIKNVITAPNITVGDYTYYDDAVDPTGFEKNKVLFNYPVFTALLRHVISITNINDVVPHDHHHTTWFVES